MTRERGEKKESTQERVSLSALQSHFCEYIWQELPTHNNLAGLEPLRIKDRDYTHNKERARENERDRARERKRDLFQWFRKYIPAKLPTEWREHVRRITPTTQRSGENGKRAFRRKCSHVNQRTSLKCDATREEKKRRRVGGSANHRTPRPLHSPSSVRQSSSHRTSFHSP